MGNEYMTLRLIADFFFALSVLYFYGRFLKLEKTFFKEVDEVYGHLLRQAVLMKDLNERLCKLEGYKDEEDETNG